MSDIAGFVKLEASRTTFQALGQQIFAGNREGHYSSFVRTLPVTGEYLSVSSLGAVPAVRELKGSRPFGSLRAYIGTAPVKRFGPDALNISAIRIMQDQNGLVAQMLADYTRDAANFWDKSLCEFLFNNPTSIDGVALYSTSHPYGAAGANWSNTSSNALTPAEFFTGVYTMGGLQLENGEPAGFYPSRIMVGPSGEKLASDLCSSDRVVPITAAGVEGYSSAVAAAAKSNWASGKITYEVNPRMVGTWANYWYLFDTTREQAMPVIFGEAKAPENIAIIDPTSQSMVDRSECQFYAEGWSAKIANIGFATYGGLAA